MKLKVCLGACAVLFASVVFGQDQPKMSAEEKAQMDAMMKAATPGDAHKKLASMVGTWDAVVKMYPMQAGAPVQTSTATSVSTWVLGGRFVQETVNGSFMGMPFNGIGYTGYDNIKKQYTGTWMDNMGTATMISTGTMTGDKTYEFTSTMDDPMTGKAMQVKEKVTVVDDDHHVMEMWGPTPDGKMMKMMEITYTRKKS
jgi:Protein of unknown function (DUF1579)